MWRSIPLNHVVLEKLRKHNTIKDEDLYKEVKNSINYDISFDEFLKVLMSLEMKGYITVSLIKENTRMITYLGDKESE